jgi:transcriptional regulator with XRE-family HTH domain
MGYHALHLPVMMKEPELRQVLTRLDLSQNEAAQLLGVGPRTVRRWLEGEDIPGPAEQALRAWIRLYERNLPWRPDAASIVEDDQDQIARHRAHMIRLDEMLARVEARGGPRVPWVVDRARRTATLGPMEVTYYKLASRSFSLGHYRRKDGEPDVQRDWEAIEDAAASIAMAMKKEPDYGPVTLVINDGPALGRVAHQTLEQFDTNEAALERVCAILGTPGVHEPFIMGANRAELIWDPRELRRECESRVKGPAALAAVADYTRRNSKFFVIDGPRMLPPNETAKRRQRIEALADELDALVEPVRQGLAGYRQFETVLGRLHAEGFFPETALVSAVAKALSGAWRQRLE